MIKMTTGMGRIDTQPRSDCALNSGEFKAAIKDARLNGGSKMYGNFYCDQCGLPLDNNTYIWWCENGHTFEPA